MAMWIRGLVIILRYVLDVSEIYEMLWCVIALLISEIADNRSATRHQK
jgi:hypothetical protein